MTDRAAPNELHIPDLVASVPEPTEEQVRTGVLAIDEYYNGTKDAPFEGSVAYVYRAMKALELYPPDERKWRAWLRDCWQALTKTRYTDRYSRTWQFDYLGGGQDWFRADVHWCNRHDESCYLPACRAHGCMHAHDE